MEDLQEDPLAVHCFCMCSGSVLLGDLLGFVCAVDLSEDILVFIHYVSFLIKDTLRCCILPYIHVCWLLWFSCQYLPSDWLERLF